jgi:DNA-binding transcriptional LysR family regulator
MELRHLRYFIAVAEELHFGRAARRLNIAQPPLSQQIRNLEDELNSQLFSRTNRRIQLTEAGQFFLKEARQILAHAEQAALTVQWVSQGEVGRLVVGFVGSVVYSFLPENLKVFRERFPGVEVVLRELNTSEQAQALLNKHIDVGFLYPPVNDPRLVFKSILHVPFIVALPESHPLSGHKEIRLGELAREPFILFSRSSEPVIYDKSIIMCHKAGFSPRMAQEASQIQTVLGLVASGLGICVIPSFIRNIKRTGVVYKPISGTSLKVGLSSACRKDNPSSIVQSFLKVTREVIRKQPFVK